jgi:hypothetical protein
MEMYPLNMHNPDAGGFAVANDEAEHKALSDAGYLPPFVAEVEAVDEPVKRGPGRPRKES